MILLHTHCSGTSTVGQFFTIPRWTFTLWAQGVSFYSVSSIQEKISYRDPYLIQPLPHDPYIRSKKNLPLIVVLDHNCVITLWYTLATHASRYDGKYLHESVCSYHPSHELNKQTNKQIGKKTTLTIAGILKVEL